MNRQTLENIEENAAATAELIRLGKIIYMAWNREPLIMLRLEQIAGDAVINTVNNTHVLCCVEGPILTKDLRLIGKKVLYALIDELYEGNGGNKSTMTTSTDKPEGSTDPATGGHLLNEADYNHLQEGANILWWLYQKLMLPLTSIVYTFGPNQKWRDMLARLEAWGDKEAEIQDRARASANE